MFDVILYTHYIWRSLSFVNICQPQSQLTNWSTTPYRLSAKAYSTYLQVPSIHGGLLLHLQHFFVTPNNSQTRLSEKDGFCTDPTIYIHLLLYRISYRRNLKKMSDPSIFISCRRSGNNHWITDNRIRSSSQHVQRTVHVTLWTSVPEILRVYLQSVFAHFRRSELPQQSASSLTQSCYC